jgi:hypothetical protein
MENNRKFFTFCKAEKSGEGGRSTDGCFTLGYYNYVVESDATVILRPTAADFIFSSNLGENLCLLCNLASYDT